MLLLLLIIGLAVVTGCYIGQKYGGAQGAFFVEKPLSRDYFIGLNYLLNEEPDKAVDIFTRLLHVDSDTVETHLALGSLFRRKGEIGRAIKIHQNLIARPQLSAELRTTALAALGKDYFQAGLVDRAEKIFLDITLKNDKAAIATSLHYLLDIYQQQKRWESAITAASQLKSLVKEDAAKQLCDIRIAHYYCECAQKLYNQKSYELAIEELKKALKQYPASIRANLLWGQTAIAEARYGAAVSIYENILNQDPAFFQEALPNVIMAYQQQKKEIELVQFLTANLSTAYAINIILFLTDYKRKTEGDDNARDFLIQQLHIHPSLKGIKYLIAWHLESTHPTEWLILKELIERLLRQHPDYQCTQCGFKSNALLWLCPSCKSWSQIKPVED